jgi:hypothetical protein
VIDAVFIRRLIPLSHLLSTAKEKTRRAQLDNAECDDKLGDTAAGGSFCDLRI